ncbi:hypothetical protein WJX77_008620 [Trebouxia sp. C0004]
MYLSFSAGQQDNAWGTHGRPQDTKCVCFEHSGCSTLKRVKPGEICLGDDHWMLMAEDAYLDCVKPGKHLCSFFKPKADRIRAKCIAVCRLHDLCTEDKGKVAKLLRQVVDLEKELTKCKAQTKKVSDELQETNQHLRHRSADLAHENSTLKAKLTHAFALLRAYQHKIRIMDAAGAAMPNPLQVASQASTAEASIYQQASCQNCGHASVVLNAVPAVNRLRQQCKPHSLLLNEARKCGAISARQNQPGSAITAADGVRMSQSSKPQPHLAASGQYAREEPFAELATEMLAWQHDDSGDQMSQQAAEESACKVLRFDPSLGSDGAFYFVSPDATQQQSNIPADRQQNPQYANAADAGLGQVQAASSSLPKETAQPGMHRIEADQSRLASPTGGPAQPDVALCNEKSSTVCTAQQQSLQEGTHAGQAGVLQAQPLFPVEGGGQAGVLLRAAAAAAAGCSHELVLAAAGKASPHADRATAERPACSSAAAAETPDADTSAVARASKADEEANGVLSEANAVSGSAGDGLQSLAELGDRAQTLDTYPHPYKDRGDEEGHSLGFDSSLMDLVAEVEQMVNCKQAHGEHRSSLASPLPGSCTDLACKAVSAQRLGGHQYSMAHQALEFGEDFEENDVISLISDQEYSMH